MYTAKTLATAAILCTVIAAPSFATVVLKQQMAEVFQGTVNNGEFKPIIGDNPPFGTTKINVTDVLGALAMKIDTRFTGPTLLNGDCFGAVCAHVADIAVSIDGGKTYGYGISLGHDVNGLTAGLYQVSSWLTSQDVWAPNGTGFQYGGKWETCSTNCTDGHAQVADTVIKNGTWIADATVVDGGTLLTVTTNDSLIGHAVSDLFWGTADCANDPIAGNIPEPASVAILSVGLVTIGAASRRRRRQIP
jgi:hypothetical protein